MCKDVVIEEYFIEFLKGIRAIMVRDELWNMIIHYKQYGVFPQEISYKAKPFAILISTLIDNKGTTINKDSEEECDIERKKSNKGYFGNKNAKKQNENKTETNENKTKTNENKTETNENKTETNENKTETNENKTKTNENKTKTNENKTETNENKTKTNENKTETNENKTKTNENKTETNENKTDFFVFDKEKEKTKEKEISPLNPLKEKENKKEKETDDDDDDAGACEGQSNFDFSETAKQSLNATLNTESTEKEKEKNCGQKEKEIFHPSFEDEVFNKPLPNENKKNANDWRGDWEKRFETNLTALVSQPQWREFSKQKFSVFSMAEKKEIFAEFILRNATDRKYTAIYYDRDLQNEQRKHLISFLNIKLNLKRQNEQPKEQTFIQRVADKLKTQGVI